ncbi:hypothetical protein ACJMQP_19700 [Rhodopseudomonas palustris]
MASSANDSLGAQSPATIIDYLRAIGDDETADRLQPPGGTGQGFGFDFGSDVWGQTGVLVGFIPPTPSGRLAAVENAYTLAPDYSLKGSRIKISLERFWVESYPGRGTHEILCEFNGKNQAQGEQEEMQFTLTTTAKDKSSAAIVGAPIFLGVTVGKNGIAFEGKTINVRSKDDEDLLAALSTGSFREGLSLLTTVQPALKPFVGLASSVVNAVMKRSENAQIQFFKLGFDFSQNQTSVALRHGSFAVIQADDASWDWTKLAWNVDAQQIVHSATGKAIPFNYLILRISPYEEE